MNDDDDDEDDDEDDNDMDESESTFSFCCGFCSFWQRSFMIGLVGFVRLALCTMFQKTFDIEANDL